ncbi:MAG: 2'-5' RNA ligase family protein [Thermaurantiacus tibetensis]|uniref:2'-5' RNA ligase family protein n=1 Tax=Thermaurantiacus tibetensis TaxID=2759035 RepID=UPI0018901682|nr:2'-5' RNA ligase family protein [Thermaurantiacus tibetensis]
MPALPLPVPGVLALTLGLDAGALARLEVLRRAAWPEAAPGVPAHLSLLRHLPGTQAPAIASEMRMEARQCRPFPLRFLGPRARGDAVFLPARATPLEALHAALVERLWPLLRPQDRAPPDLHVTLAAGRTAAEARRLAAALAGCTPTAARADRLLLWRLGSGGPGSGTQPGWSLLVSVALGR